MVDTAVIEIKWYIIYALAVAFCCCLRLWSEATPKAPKARSPIIEAG